MTTQVRAPTVPIYLAGEFVEAGTPLEVRNPATVPVIHQQGTFAPADGIHRWMGSAAMDRFGNFAVGYSVSNGTVFPGIRYAGRLATDPLGELTQGEAEMQVGSGSQTSTVGAPATRVTTTTAERLPGPLSCLASASGSIGEPRFFTTTRPTPVVRSSARSFVRLNGSTSVTR